MKLKHQLQEFIEGSTYGLSMMNWQIAAMVYYDRDDEVRDAKDFLALKILLD